MKQYLLIAVGAVALSSALFQPANAQSSAGAIAGSESQSGAAAQAGARALGVGVGGGGGSSSSGSQSSSTNQNIVGSGNTYNYEAPDLGDHVPTMFIPNLTTSNGTCMGSFSSGLVVSGFGGGLGKTYTSEECNARFNANQMNALKAPGVAYEIMCGMDDVYEADMRSAKAHGTVPRCAIRDDGATIDPVAIAEPDMKWFYQDELGAYHVIEHDVPDVAVVYQWDHVDLMGEK